MDLIERVQLAIWDGEDTRSGDPIGTVIYASEHLFEQPGESPIEAAKGVCLDAAKAAITEAFTVPAEPSEADRQRYQALCDELDRMGYRPTGWVDPPVLR